MTRTIQSAPNVPSPPRARTLPASTNNTYVLTFDLANDNGGVIPVNNFAVSIGGVPVFTFTNLANQNFTHQQFTFKALAAATLLSFSGANDQSYLELDNVSVTATPEPSSAVLLSMVMLAMGIALNSAKRRGVFVAPR